MKGKQQATVSPRLKFLLLPAILVATPGLAAAQFMCVDKAGHITLTDVACPGRNIRGKNNAEKANQAGAPENTQVARNSSGNNSRNSSATVPGGSVPARQQSPDTANEKPRSR